MQIRMRVCVRVCVFVCACEKVSVSVSVSVSDLRKDCFLLLVIFYKQNKSVRGLLGLYVHNSWALCT